MKQIKLVVLLSLFFVGNAVAGDTYWGVDLRTMDYESRGFEADLVAVTGKFGYKVIDHFSIEGFAGIGVSDDTTGSGVSRTDLDVDQIFGIYAKGEYPINNTFIIYGNIGYAEVKITGETATAKATDSTSDTSYGAGLAYNVNSDMAISIDYTKYIDKSFLELNGVTLSCNIKL